MVLAQLVQLQIFWHLYLIELLGAGATGAVALDISKAFDRVWHVGLLHKLKSYRISGQIFGIILSFLSNRQLWVVLDGKSSQKYPVNAGDPQGSILGPTLFPTIHEWPSCNIADDTTKVQSGIWSGATTRTGFLTWIWSMRHCELGQVVGIKSTGFNWLL